MVDAERGGDGADLPMLAVIEPANLGVLLGRDHGAPPGTRDGSARAVEGARRFPGHRPYSATRPPGARSASVRRRVSGQCGARTGARGSVIPHAGAIRPLMIAMIEAAFRAGPMALAGGAHRSRRAAVRHGDEQYAWPRSHDAQIAKRRLQRRQVFWRSGASTMSERRRASTGHGAQIVAQRDDWLGPSEHRGGHRGPGGF